MATIEDLIAEMLSELAILQNSEEPLFETGKNFPIPSMLSVDDGRAIFISDKIEQSILSVAKLIQENDEALQAGLGARDLRTIARRAFGNSLAKLDLSINAENSARCVKKAVRRAIKDAVRNDSQPQERSWGCDIFGDPEIPPFDVGPVRFERREDWLIRKDKNGSLTRTSVRRIGKAWQGKKSARRKPSLDYQGEKAVLEAVGNCQYVCSVSIAGTALGIGRDRAVSAAHITMASIALCWSKPAEALDGFRLLSDRGRDGRPGVLILKGDRSKPLSDPPSSPGPVYMTSEQWRSLRDQDKWGRHFAVSSDAIAYYLNPTKTHAQPKMMSTLIHALLWFHEGCKERLPLMATVKFAASMDALACGRKKKGILELISHRLGPSKNDLLFKDGMTASKAVNEIYEVVRSRTIHGTNEKWYRDWSETRSRSEVLARLCLLCCIDWISKNPVVDEPEKLSAS